MGSKEGWTPSQFVSSRKSRAQVNHRPEDYMDEEDLQVNYILFHLKLLSLHKIGATANYDQAAMAEHDNLKRQNVNQSILNESSALKEFATKLAQDMIMPSMDPIGHKLLRNMGWRPGQGVGPRAKRKYSLVDDEYTPAKDFLFAPKNTDVAILKGKTDSFGLGYDPLKNAPEFSKHNPNISQKNKGAGFGVGIFEDEDEDVYSMDAQYEATIDDDEDRFFQRNQKNPSSKILFTSSKDAAKVVF